MPQCIFDRIYIHTKCDFVQMITINITITNANYTGNMTYIHTYYSDAVRGK